jgi:hypothetical protein
MHQSLLYTVVKDVYIYEIEILFNIPIFFLDVIESIEIIATSLLD